MEGLQDAAVIIVGGGPAGLSTAAALKKRGFDPLILDKHPHIGDSWANRYQRLHLHTIRAFSGLAHWGIPRTYPKYPSKDQYAQYLQAYADHFKLRIALNTIVHKISSESAAPTQTYRIETNHQTYQCKVVVIAAGQFNSPTLPNWRGAQTYRGQLIHSAQYSTGRDFKNHQVLVIGAGNSGAEIAIDLTEQGASHVALSIRTPPPLVPRDFVGTPIQLSGILLSPLPPRLADKIAMLVSKLALGNLTRYGLQAPGWQPFTAKRTPVIDVGLVQALKQGRVLLRPGVLELTPTGVIYSDGTTEDFDDVIAATGFKTGLENMLDLPNLLDKNGMPQAPSGAPTNQRGLYFMGYFESHRGHLFETNRASRRLARTISTYLK